MMSGTRTQRTALLATKILILVLIAVSPRALLAPGAIYNRSVESRRPKSPRNIVRTDPIRISNLEKQGQGPKPSPNEASRPGIEGWIAQASPLSSLPHQAFTQLTKPDYLKLGPSSHPQNRLDPPV